MGLMSMMVNFRCQVVCVQGYPDSWQSILSGMSVRVFLGENGF
jgi:hypothetical protein